MSARYDVEAVIGRGAMGVVYRARQVGTGRRVVAYKRVASSDPHLLERLRSEAEVLAALDHPNIIRIFDVVEDGEGLAIVMQYASGGSLAHVLAQRGPLPADLTASVIATLAEALASAHRQSVLHRDIKPANILFTADGNPLLSDFGVARRTDSTPMTDVGALGPATCEYLDPAVADGAPFDERSDCYALGVVAYEMLTGRRPFGGDTPLAVLRAADQGDAPPLRVAAPMTPPGVAAAVEAAMARRPESRPAGAAEFAAALRAAMTAGAVASPAGPPAAAPAGDEPPQVHDPPTREFGPRPPVPAQQEAPRAVPWKSVAAVAACLLLLPPTVAGVVKLRAPDRQHGPPALATAPPAAAPPAAAPPAAASTAARPDTVCRGVEVPRPGQGEVVLTGDLTGRGCRSWARYADGLLEAALQPRRRTMRYRAGVAGDRLLLGDWDCNGSDTPALYRPGTGEVFHFDAWAPADEPLTSRPGENSGVVSGTARVEREGACSRVAVEAAADPSV